MSIVAPVSNTGGTIPRIDRARGTTMQTCNSGSVPPIAEPEPTGQTSAIARNAWTAVVEPVQIAPTGKRARAGRPATGKLPATGRLQGMSDRVARRAGRRTAQLREPVISGRPRARAVAVALGSPAGDIELPRSGAAGATEAAAAFGVVGAAADAGLTSG